MEYEYPTKGQGGKTPNSMPILVVEYLQLTGFHLVKLTFVGEVFPKIERRCLHLEEASSTHHGNLRGTPSNTPQIRPN